MFEKNTFIRKLTIYGLMRLFYSFSLYKCYTMLESNTCSVDSSIVVFGVDLSILECFLLGSSFLSGKFLSIGGQASTKRCSTETNVLVVETLHSLAFKSNWVGKVGSVEQWVASESSLSWVTSSTGEW